MFELGIISDEVSSDFERSCKLIKSWDLSHVELRTLWGRNILELSEHELERARDMLDKYELTVTAIASPIFKSPLNGKSREADADFALADSGSFEEQLHLLERASDLCTRFDTRKIRVFTFLREPWSKDLVHSISSKLIQAAEVARERGVVLAIENEPVCNVRYGWEISKLFAKLETQASAQLLEHLAILWDPGNALYAGEQHPFPDGYQVLPKSKVAHLHLKDVAFGEDGNPLCVPLGWGEVDFIGQLRQLAGDGYGGPFVLEPHYCPKGIAQEEAAYTCVKAARRALQEAFSEL